MFGAKSLLRCKRTASVCLCFATKANKPNGITVLGVVNYNKENKYLFGDLLETRAQRRKTIKKEQETSTKGNQKHLEENCGKSIDSPSKSASKAKKRQKTKSSTIEKRGSRSGTDYSVINNVGQGDQHRMEHSFTKSSNDKTRLDAEFANKIASSSSITSQSDRSRNCVESATKVELPDRTENIETQIPQLFPLINSKKSLLKYEDSTKNIINISYESVRREVLTSFPSVGKILSETMPAAARAALERWKKNMIAELGVEGFEKLNKANLARGVLFHDYLRRFLVDECIEDELPEKVHYYFKSLADVFPRITDVKVVESHVVHPELNYCGFVDCVAKFNGTPVIIEWKLAEKPKCDIRSTYDAPLQMCAYLGALNYDENYNFPVKSGLVVAAYTDGSPANVFHLSEEKCIEYWKGFQGRLFEYQKLKSIRD